MLEDEPTFRVIGEASDGLEAIKLAEELHPDVIVMDCALPQINGIEAARRILEKLRATAILMLSMHSEDTLSRQALEAGARGYILKNAMDLDLVSAIKRVAKGQTVLDPQISRTGTLKGERDSGLTPRELEILQHIVAGKSNKEIASELNVSERTIKFHVSSLLSKFKVHSRLELVREASQQAMKHLPVAVASPATMIREFTPESEVAQRTTNSGKILRLARPRIMP